MQDGEDHHRTVAVVMRAAILAIAVSLSAGNAQPNRTNDMLREWADAVLRHHAGERDKALESLGEWTYNDLELMQPLLEAFVGTPERNDDLRAAARRARLSGRDRAMVREAAKGRAADAKTSFDRALTAYPESQAARLGLAAAIAIDGKREDALAALLPTLMASPERTGDDDPWWVYDGRSRDEALSALERVRSTFGSSRR